MGTVQTDGIDWGVEDYDELDDEVKMMLRDQTRVALYREKIADVVGSRYGGGGCIDAHSLDFHGLTVARQRLELAKYRKRSHRSILETVLFDTCLCLIA
jgi:hypothetical protein